MCGAHVWRSCVPILYAAVVWRSWFWLWWDRSQVCAHQGGEGLLLPEALEPMLPVLRHPPSHLPPPPHTQVIIGDTFSSLGAQAFGAGPLTDRRAILVFVVVVIILPMCFAPSLSALGACPPARGGRGAASRSVHGRSCVGRAPQ